MSRIHLRAGLIAWSRDQEGTKIHDLWRTEPDGILSVEIGGFRLIVQAPEKVGGRVRFMVLRRSTIDEHDVLIGSGSEENVRAAIVAAERMAKRCAAS